MSIEEELNSLRARLGRLEAKEACLSTFNEYLHHLDGDHLEDLLAVFAPDAILAVIDFPPGSGKDLHFNGRDDLKQLYSAHHGGMGRHHSANVTVNVEGSEAELSAYFATSGAYGWGGGVYQMTLRAYPDAGKWLIQEMRIVSTWGWRIKSDEPPYLERPREGRPAGRTARRLPMVAASC